MIKNFITTKLLDNLDFQPTESQKQLIVEISRFIETADMKEILLIKGYAGTGKTTIVNSIVKTLKQLDLGAVLLAPTGRAAKVMHSYANYPSWTIHKKIYRQRSGSDGMGSFELDRNLHKDTFFIVDEASMIGQTASDSVFGTGDLLSDLIQFIEEGSRCRLVLIGDTAQLPPVKLDVSPALDTKILHSYGYRVSEFIMTDIVRQGKESGILLNATALRKMITDGSITIPNLNTDVSSDIERVSGAELLECISSCYDRYGEEDTIVVTRSNKRANQFNAGIRGQILWREEQISRGDLLMIVKNNYFWKDEEQRIDFIANGDIARIERVIRFEEIYGLRFAEVDLALIDHENLEIQARIMLDVFDVEGPSLPADVQNNLYNKILEDYPDLTTKKKRAEQMMKDPYFNALQVKFAYSVTCHKAQGGQWKAVFIDLGYFTDEMISTDFLRWLYTAFTRATEKLYLINFPNNFFE